MTRCFCILIFYCFIVSLVQASPSSAQASKQYVMEKMERRLLRIEQEITASEIRLKKLRTEQTGFKQKYVLPKKSSDELPPTSPQPNLLLNPKKNHKNTLISIPKNTGIVTVGKKGFRIQSLSGDNRLSFNGVIQADQDVFMQTRGVTINNGISSEPVINGNNVDRIWLRRIRPALSGTILKYTDFLITPDFGQGQLRLFDAFVDVHYLDWLSFNAGKEISLLAGLDNIKEPSTMYTMEPGYPTMMAPNREIGFMFHGALNAFRKQPSDEGWWYNYFTSGMINYQIGIFSGTADNSNPGLNPVTATAFSTETATFENKALEIRIFTNPFQGSDRTYLEGLGLGIAMGFDNPDNEIKIPALFSVGQDPIFIYNQTITINGARQRIHPQAYWFYGPLGVIGDWAQTKETMVSGPVPSAAGVINRYSTQNNQASQVMVVYNVTGERNDFLVKIKPNHPFDPMGEGTWGALQLVGRWTNLQMDGNVFNANTTIGDQTIYSFADPRLSVRQANTWSLGFNWFWNRNLRMTTEYDQTSFLGGCSTGGMSAAAYPGCLTSGTAATASTSEVRNRQSEKVIMQRIQLLY